MPPDGKTQAAKVSLGGRLNDAENWQTTVGQDALAFGIHECYVCRRNCALQLWQASTRTAQREAYTIASRRSSCRSKLAGGQLTDDMLGLAWHICSTAVCGHFARLHHAQGCRKVLAAGGGGRRRCLRQQCRLLPPRLLQRLHNQHGAAAETMLLCAMLCCCTQCSPTNFAASGAH